MSRRNVWVGMQLFVMIFISALTVACTSSVEEIVLRSKAPDRVNGFAAGEEYVTTQPMYLVKQGSISALIPQDQLKVSGFNHGRDLRTISSGTGLKVLSVKGSNTLTHGSMFWPECRILTGAYKGVRASLGHREIPRYVRRVK